MALINIEKLIGEFVGDEEILHEIILVFLGEAPKLLHKLDEAIKIKDFKKIELHAHTIKGAVSNFHAQAVKDIAFKLEVAGRENSLGEVITDFSFLVFLIEQLSVELKEIPNREKGK